MGFSKTGWSLFIIAADRNPRLPAVIHDHVYIDRPATNLAVLDVFLISARSIDQHDNSLSAIRTTDFNFVLQAHSV